MKTTRVLWAWIGFVGLISMAGTAHALPYTAEVLADSPVGYWRLNEGAGTAANSGTAAGLLNATYQNANGTGPSLVGDLDASSSFNGVQTAAGTHLTGSGLNSVGGGNPFTNDWTIEAWFVRDTNSDWTGVVSNNRGGTAAPLMTFSGVGGPSNHNLGINGAGVTANGVWVDLNQLTGVQQYLGKPVYAMITKTGANGAGTANLTVTANVGGIWLGPATGTNTGWTLTPRDGFYIGRHYDGQTQMHDGLIDEAAIYSSALSQSRMLAHYHAATGGPDHYARAVLPDGPVGYWRLDEPNTANTAGSQGTALGILNGQYSAPKTDAPGLMQTTTNTAASFDGTNDHVTGSGLNTVAGGNPFAGDWTIEAWFVRQTADSSWEGVFSNNVGISNAPIMTFFDAAGGRSRHWLGMNPAGSSPTPDIYVDLGQFGGSSTDYLGERVYAAMTLAGSQLSMYVNVDDVWLPMATATLGRALSLGDGFYIGRHYSGGLQLFDGIIDEVALYGYALTPSQVKAHYAARVPEPASLVLLGIGGAALARRRRR